MSIDGRSTNDESVEKAMTQKRKVPKPEKKVTWQSSKKAALASVVIEDESTEMPMSTRPTRIFSKRVVASASKYAKAMCTEKSMERPPTMASERLDTSERRV